MLYLFTALIDVAPHISMNISHMAYIISKFMDL